MFYREYSTVFRIGFIWLAKTEPISGRESGILAHRTAGARRFICAENLDISDIEQFCSDILYFAEKIGKHLFFSWKTILEFRQEKRFWKNAFGILRRNVFRKNDSGKNTFGKTVTEKRY